MHVLGGQLRIASLDIDQALNVVKRVHAELGGNHVELDQLVKAGDSLVGRLNRLAGAMRDDRRRG